MDYTSLKSNIADWLNRDDLTAVIPTFIELAHAELNLIVKHWRREARSTATIDSRFLALPLDWQNSIRFELTTAPLVHLKLSTSNQIASKREEFGTAGGQPTDYALTGGTFEFWPTPDKEYPAELLYRAKIPALSDGSLTNWLIDLMPACYLYGSLLQSAPYLKDDPRIQVWQTLYDQAVGTVNTEGEAATLSGTGLRIKPKGWA